MLGKTENEVFQENTFDLKDRAKTEESLRNISLESGRFGNPSTFRFEFVKAMKATPETKKETTPKSESK